MRNIFTIDRIIIFLASTLFGMLVNVFSNWVSTIGGWLLTALFAAVAVTSIIAIIYLARANRVTVRLSPTTSLRDPQKKLRYARKGLIAFVSLYNPKKDAAFDSLSGPERQARLAELKQAALDGDYAPLNLESSNLEPLIKAILAHQSNLRHCWLIATPGENGSQVYLPALIKYLREVKRLPERQGEQGCEFHFGPQYQVSIDNRNETEVVADTRQLVDGIFQAARAKEIRLKDTDIVADITGAPRHMMFGMLLACLDRQRDIQFIATEYDQAGQPKGEPLPMIYHFEPLFVKNE